MTRLVALTRSVSPAIVDHALSYVDREPIDVSLAHRQHAGYEDALRGLGIEVLSLPKQPHMPDAVFVEDTAVVTDEIAILTAPALPSRRVEVDSVAEALTSFRPIRRLTGDATLEGGDVLRVGHEMYVGLSRRTNEEGVRQLRAHLQPFGYRVTGIAFAGCLHLKSACTYIGRDTILANTEWVDAGQFPHLQILAVAADEEMAGNVLLVGDTLLMPANFPLTLERLEEHDFNVLPVSVSELQKAEAGVTCCSVLFTL
ncbi:MAG: dimethylarginine dimethylaminohydrolase family protein [Chloroflexota bacterium]|nr:MAG: dimethylargininase [Chloroflexota bacterium]